MCLSAFLAPPQAGDVDRVRLTLPAATLLAAPMAWTNHKYSNSHYGPGAMKPNKTV